MSFQQSLQQRMGQQMLLLPRMLQSIEVLQLPVDELNAWLRQAAEENEAVAFEEARLPERLPRERAAGSREATDRHDEMLRNQPDRERGTTERLLEQLALLEVDAAELEWVRFLVDCLDENGYLSTDDETLLRLARERGLQGDATTLARAVALLQRLEPRGIGARDAVEALLLQLDPEEPDYGVLCILLEDFIEEVAKNKLPAVAKAMGIDVAELTGLIERLKQLDLRPAAKLVDEAAPPIHPDVVVERDGDGFEVRVERSSLPSVRVDASVVELARDRGQPADVRKYLREKVDRAKWLVEAVEQRADTLQRIAGALFRHQHEFLVDGPGHLAPLRMNALAEELDLHVSTVSRGVAGKYAQTPWGILPLRFFFQAEGAGGSSREDVREVVRAVIEGEDPAKPLSDDEIVAALEGRGLQLARRTVSKYRKELGIPSSYRRRTYS